jgi:hypothetical protein
MGKSPLTSKTLWVNLLAVVGIVAQAKFGAVVPPEAQTLILALGNLGLRLITGQPIDLKKVKLSGLQCLLVAVSLGMLMTPALSGCAVMRATEEHPVLTELAVRAAVARVLEERPGWARPTERITADAISLLGSDDQVTLADLEGYVLQQIPWTELAPEEEELLRVLIRAIRDETELYLERQGVADPGETGVRVARVLGWINQTAAIRRDRASQAGEN